MYLVPDALIGVHSSGTERREDAGGNLCYAVEVVCGGKAQYTSGARSWEGIFSCSAKGRDQNTLSSL